VSWGTKGSDKAEALPSVKSNKAKGADAVVDDTTKVQEDVDAAFKETVTRALTKIDIKEVPEKPTMDDQNKTFRTRLVAFWMLSNASLAVAIENINGLQTNNDLAEDQIQLQQKQSFYFAVILYSTFALAAVRFTGVGVYVLVAWMKLMFVRHPPVRILFPQKELIPVLSEELRLFWTSSYEDIAKSFINVMPIPILLVVSISQSFHGWIRFSTNIMSFYPFNGIQRQYKWCKDL